MTDVRSEAMLPAVYSEARNALAKCARIDECKSWADRAAALYAHEIGRKPVAIAAAAALTMIRALSRSLRAARKRLPVIIAESARYARRKPGVVQGAKSMI
jgi:hypothetical protein